MLRHLRKTAGGERFWVGRVFILKQRTTQKASLESQRAPEQIMVDLVMKSKSVEENASILFSAGIKVMPTKPLSG